MNQPIIKVTTAAACRIVKLERTKFNEAVTDKLLTCMPETIAGRNHVFTPDDLLSLWYYRELMEDGYRREKAGMIACAIGKAARQHPNSRAIALVEDYFRPSIGTAVPIEQLPDLKNLDNARLNETDIRKVTIFRVSKARELIAFHTQKEVEAQAVGEAD